MIEYGILLLSFFVIYGLGVMTPFIIIKVSNNLSIRMDNSTQKKVNSEIQEEEEKKVPQEPTTNFSNLTDELINEWQNGGGQSE